MSKKMYFCIQAKKMIRLIEPTDIEKIQSLTELNLNEIDIQNSAIDLDDNGTIKSIILARSKPLISVFPKSRFPNTRQCRNGMAFYKHENNHQIVFLYKADRNGRSISATFSFLLNMYGQRGIHWWWVDKNIFNSDKEFTKIRAYLCPINNTPYYYTY